MIDAQDLLLSRGLLPGKDSRLGWSGECFAPLQIFGGNRLFSQDMDYVFSCCIFPNDTYGNRLCPERMKIEKRISCSSQGEIFVLVAEDENRCLPGYTPGVSVEVFIEEDVSPNDDLLSGEGVDDFENSLVFLVNLFFRPKFLSKNR